MNDNNTKSGGRYARQDDDQAIRNRDTHWQEIRKAEDDYAFQKRKRQVLLIGGLILTTAAMIGFIEFDQISCNLAMCFNAALAAVFGHHIGRNR